MAIHSSILVWRIPWTEEPGGLWSTELQTVRHDCSNLTEHIDVYITNDIIKAIAHA